MRFEVLTAVKMSILFSLEDEGSMFLRNVVSTDNFTRLYYPEDGSFIIYGDIVSFFIRA
jgi:hypothetical protein